MKKSIYVIRQKEDIIGYTTDKNEAEQFCNEENAAAQTGESGYYYENVNPLFSK